MATAIIGVAFSTSTFHSFPKIHHLRRRHGPISAVQYERPPLEEIYNIRVEHQVSKKRLEELGVEKWSNWRTGKCRLPWDWNVDQQVYVVKGEVRVVPEGMVKRDDDYYYMRFVEGDLIRYPKWFEADLFFNGPYEEKYRFRAYGDDD